MPIRTFTITRKTLIGSTGGVIAGLALGVSLISQAQQPPRDTSGGRSSSVPEVERLEDLRPVTASQKARAKQFNSRRADVQDLLRRGGGVVGTPSERDMVVPADGALAKPLTLEERLRDAACRYQTVFGTVQTQSVFLSSDEHSLFTDYTVTVRQWIRPRGGPTTITASALGGVVKVGNRMLDLAIGPRIVARRHYVIYMKPLLDDVGFELVSATEVFERQDGTGRETLALESQSYLDALQRSTSQCQPER